MNYRLMTKVIGKMILFESIAMLLPLAVAVAYDGIDVLAFMWSALICLVCGFWLSCCPAGDSPIRIRESLAIITFGWLSVSAFGALPYLLSGVLNSPVDALFETIGGFTTTGATIFSTVEDLPRGILFWRSLTGWIGGVGILIFIMAVLPSMDAGSLHMLKAESPGPLKRKLHPHVRESAQILCAIYVALTMTEALLLRLGGLSMYDALLHSFGTLSTSGFSCYDNSIGHYNSPYVDFVVGLFMFFSSINFAFYFTVWKGNWREAIKDEETRFYAALVMGGAIIVTLNLFFHKVFGMGILHTLRYGMFHTVATITTTGFSTANYDMWPTFSRWVLFCLMFVGGSSGSAAGAIKSVRILICIKAAKREVLSLIHPRAVQPVKLNGKAISPSSVSAITGFTSLYFIILFLGSVVVSSDGVEMIDAVAAVMVSLSNLGTGFGMVGPTGNYSAFSDHIKLTLAFFMLVGRLEIYTVLALFIPRYWRR